MIKNCNIDGADRLFHLNMSGNEPWQRGIPPTDVTFENIKAKNIMTGLYAYGKEGCPFNLTLRNVEYEYKKGNETEPFIKTAYFEKIKLENVTVTNYKGHAFIKNRYASLLTCIGVFIPHYIPPPSLYYVLYVSKFCCKSSFIES